MSLGWAREGNMDHKYRKITKFQWLAVALCLWLSSQWLGTGDLVHDAGTVITKTDRMLVAAGLRTR